MKTQQPCNFDKNMTMDYLKTGAHIQILFVGVSACFGVTKFFGPTERIWTVRTNWELCTQWRLLTVLQEGGLGAKPPRNFLRTRSLPCLRALLVIRCSPVLRENFCRL